MVKRKKKAPSRAKTTKAKVVKTEKKQDPEISDPFEGEYGTLQVIYITKADRERLNGDESYGPWYKVIEYSKSPSKIFCFKTVVGQSALENGRFHPSRFEVDYVAEMCEQVSDKEIALLDKKEKPKPPVVKKGQTVWVSIHGLYDEDQVVRVSKGKVWLDVAEGPFDAITGKDLSDQTYATASMKVLFEKPKDFKRED